MDGRQQAGDEALGEPLNIRQVAKLIGCSAWTVRQVLIRDGLPHFRSAPNGKMTFFKRQVVRWIVNRQHIHTQR